MFGLVRSGLAIAFVVALAACETPQEINTEAPPQFDTTTAILLAPPDVELSVLTASGVEEPRADWTETGLQNVMAALRAENARRGVGFIELDYASLTAEEQAEIGQIEKLHRAVAASMMAHRHVPALRLPTKTSVYDWSLGSEVATLRKANGGKGDYVLFVTLHDSFSSAGRVAMQVFVGLLTGYAPRGGVQVGYASLVDLDTGQIAWFGSVAKGSGDLREAAGAAKTVAVLLEMLPV
jgi:hypothetical protein